jgi:hypothetical protein
MDFIPRNMQNLCAAGESIFKPSPALKLPFALKPANNRITPTRGNGLRRRAGTKSQGDFR